MICSAPTTSTSTPTTVAIQTGGLGDGGDESRVHPAHKSYVLRSIHRRKLPVEACNHVEEPRERGLHKATLGRSLCNDQAKHGYQHPRATPKKRIKTAPNAPWKRHASCRTGRSNLGEGGTATTHPRGRGYRWFFELEVSLSIWRRISSGGREDSIWCRTVEHITKP